jgi:outer membrane immunogenic protein
MAQAICGRVLENRAYWVTYWELIMHRFRCAALVAVVVFGFAAVTSAADLPVKAPAYSAPVTVPYSWQGFYVGGHFGYAWGSDPITFTPDLNYAPAMAAGVTPRSLAGNPKGVLGGVQYGTNWQVNQVVLGWESDFSFSDIKASQTYTINPAGVTNFGEQKLTWFSTTRGRAGFTITDNLLLYGTGGLASGRASASSSFLLTGCGGIGNCVAGSDTKTLWGWTAGGGLEYGIGHWSMRVEYLHYDLGHLNYNMTDPTAPGAFIEASTKFSGDMIRGGVNYRFDWTPWELIFGRHS